VNTAACEVCLAVTAQLSTVIHQSCNADINLINLTSVLCTDVQGQKHHRRANNNLLTFH